MKRYDDTPREASLKQEIIKIGMKYNHNTITDMESIIFPPDGGNIIIKHQDGSSSTLGYGSIIHTIYLDAANVAIVTPDEYASLKSTTFDNVPVVGATYPVSRYLQLASDSDYNHVKVHEGITEINGKQFKTNTSVKISDLLNLTANQTFFPLVLPLILDRLLPKHLAKTVLDYVTWDGNISNIDQFFSMLDGFNFSHLNNTPKLIGLRQELADAPAKFQQEQARKEAIKRAEAQARIEQKQKVAIEAEHKAKAEAEIAAKTKTEMQVKAKAEAQAEIAAEAYAKAKIAAEDLTKIEVFKNAKAEERERELKLFEALKVNAAEDTFQNLNINIPFLLKKDNISTEKGIKYLQALDRSPLITMQLIKNNNQTTKIKISNVNIEKDLKVKKDGSIDLFKLIKCTLNILEGNALKKFDSWKNSKEIFNKQVTQEEALQQLKQIQMLEVNDADVLDYYEVKVGEVELGGVDEVVMAEDSHG